MTITDKLEYEKIYRILQKTVKSKEELEEFMGSLTQNILKQGESHDKLSMALFLLQEEIIPFSELFTYSLYINGKQIINEYTNGIKNCIERSIYDYDISVYYGNSEVTSYANIENIDSEVERILDSVDEEIFHYELIDGKEVKVSDGKGLALLINTLKTGSIASEFLRINNTISKMLSEKRLFIYSAMLNYSKSEIDKTVVYKSLINLPQEVYGKILDNWDQIRRIFIEFLENLSKRTINY